MRQSDYRTPGAEAQPWPYWLGVYAAHARTAGYQRRVAEAQEQVSRFLSRHESKRVRISLSGGKDSTALALLVSQQQPVPGLFFSDDLDFPGQRAYVEALPLPTQVLDCPFSAFDYLRTFDFTQVDISAHGNPLAEAFFQGMNQYMRENGITGQLWGLRAQESKARHQNFNRRGYCYPNAAAGTEVCQPLAKWSGRDVLAYLLSQGIEPLDVYKKTRFVGSPEAVRIDYYVPYNSNSYGRQQGYLWLKYYYPDLFAGLAAINPNVRSHV